MQLSDRNSRLILVISGIGLFGFVLKAIMNSITTSFSSIYLTSFPLGVSQVFSTLLLANALIILCVGVIYCYFELHNYGNYSEEEKEKYMNLADKWYLLLLKISYTSLFMLFVLIFSLFALLPIVLAFKLTSLIIFSIILLIILMASINKWRKNWWKELISRIKILKHYITQSIIVLVWSLVLPVSTIAAVSTNLNTQLDINFNEASTPSISFHFTDHLPDKMPDEIKVTILSSSEEAPIVLKKSTFNVSSLEVTGTDQNNMILESLVAKSDFILVKQSNFSFNKSLELPQLKKLKEGYIEITFYESSGISGKKKYRIINHFNVNDGKIKFQQEDFSIEL